MQDAAIRGTNDDATTARLSSASLGYFTDPFAAYFVRGRPSSTSVSLRKPPIINRGSFARFDALHSIVSQFVRSSEAPDLDRQIVVLGAGFDSRFFMLKSESIQPRRFIEIDFPEITSKKAQVIKKNKAMADLLGDHVLAVGGSEIHGNEYSLISGDLRQWHSEIVPKLLAVGFDANIPTLFLTECVLVYMPPEAIKTVIDWCAQYPISSIMLNYEQVNPDDSFGRMMLENLKLRNVFLPGLISCPTLESHKARYADAGFNGATHAITMWEYYEYYVTPEEHARLGKLEIFDEVEEWKLMAEHYCITWAWQTKNDADKEWLNAIQLHRVL